MSSRRTASQHSLFDTLDGTISGWNPAVDPDNAIIMVDNSTELPFPASYTGLALGQNSKGQNILYAADGGYSPTFSNNRFDMFGGTFDSRGFFTDPNVVIQYPGNTAFQVENEDGKLYVTSGGFTPPFGGVVDIFDTDGNLHTPNHFAANAPEAGPLVNPWANAKAPSNFGVFSNALLIGNVEEGMSSRGEPKENRPKAKEHGLSFPVVLQQQWGISRRSPMFDTVNSVVGECARYTGIGAPSSPLSMQAGISQAAHDTLASLFPSQATGI